MLYALIGTGLVGALASAFLLWRKSVVETALATAEAVAANAQARLEGLEKTLTDQSTAYEVQISHLTETLATLKGQRDQALDQLAKTGAPGSLADILRSKAKVPPTP